MHKKVVNLQHNYFREARGPRKTPTRIETRLVLLIVIFIKSFFSLMGRPTEIEGNGISQTAVPLAKMVTEKEFNWIHRRE